MGARGPVGTAVAVGVAVVEGRTVDGGGATGVKPVTDVSGARADDERSAVAEGFAVTTAAGAVGLTATGVGGVLSSRLDCQTTKTTTAAAPRISAIKRNGQSGVFFGLRAAGGALRSSGTKAGADMAGAA